VYKSGVFPAGFYLNIFSDFQIEKISLTNYLRNERKFNFNEFRIKHPNLERDCMFMMMKLKITIEIVEKNFENFSENLFFKFFINQCEINRNPTENVNNLKKKIKINNNNNNINQNSITKSKFNEKFQKHQNYLKKFLNLFFIDNKNEIKKISLQEFFKYKLEDYKNNSSSSVTENYLILTFTPPINIPENDYMFQILHSNPEENTYPGYKIKIENINQIEPFEINDLFTPNKKGLIFKERIFPLGKILASFSIGLKDSKGDNIPNSNLIRLNLEITKFSLQVGEMLIYKEEFFTKTNIVNIELNDSSSGIDNNSMNNFSSFYTMKCSIDINEISFINDNQPSSWYIRTFSSGPIFFVKDTSKEDEEKEIKLSWETKEPGRAEKGKLSRMKFLLQLRKEKGESLTAEEENVISRERARRKTVAEGVDTLKDITKALSNKMKKKVSMNVLKSITLSSQKKLTYNTLVAEEEATTKEIKGDIPNNLSNKTPNVDALMEAKLVKDRNSIEKGEDLSNNLDKSKSGSIGNITSSLKPLSVSSRGSSSRPEDHNSKFVKDFLNYTNSKRLVIIKNHNKQ
jgi:hypothetical protein